jgi:hypothetical protein
MVYWADGLLKLTMDWAKIGCLLKFGYPMGHPRVGKNTCSVPVLFLGRVRVAPMCKKLCSYLSPSGRIPVGYSLCIPELPSLLVVINERKIPTLMIWYVLMIDRLKLLISNSRDAKFMIWHAAPDGCKKDGKLWHPANA